jgi:hypothetical protein
MTPDSLKKAINIAVMQKYGALSEEANALQKLYATEKAFMNWQPIETAPKDGTEILMAVRYPVDETIKGVWDTLFGYFDTNFEEYPDGIWAFDCNLPIITGRPTHWMPVPHYTPPTTES